MTRARLILVALALPARAFAMDDAFCTGVKRVVAARTSAFAGLGDRSGVAGLDCRLDAEVSPASYSCTLRVKDGTSKDDEALVVRVDACLDDFARERAAAIDPKRARAYGSAKLVSKDGGESIEFISGSDIDMGGDGGVFKYRWITLTVRATAKR